MPPITVPAWTSMVSGRDPGELGLYGFRKRERGSYELSMVQSSDVHCERVWDVLAQGRACARACCSCRLRIRRFPCAASS